MQQLAVVGIWVAQCTMMRRVAVQMQKWQWQGHGQHHGCRGSCSTDAAVAVAGPWVAVQDVAVQRMLGNRPSIITGTDAE